MYMYMYIDPIEAVGIVWVDGVVISSALTITILALTVTSD